MTSYIGPPRNSAPSFKIVQIPPLTTGDLVLNRVFHDLSTFLNLNNDFAGNLANISFTNSSCKLILLFAAPITLSPYLMMMKKKKKKIMMISYF
ncbi:hypothetical protein Lal_00029351 [Lupinus albus]|nr:hypothetical protein Lal_00029351 [Lupinus albus]